MTAEGISVRTAGTHELDAAMADASARSWSVLAGLAPAQWRVPFRARINPPLWEYGHVAWFTELWVLREARWTRDGSLETRGASMLAGSDRWFDSSRVEHADRWTLDMPALAEIRDYARAVHEAVQAKLAGADKRDLYAFRLALFHEDMHGEALVYMRQTLDYPSPLTLPMPSLAACADDVEVGARAFIQGSPPGDAFVFDNEKWAHPVTLATFRIARRCVSNAAYADFVDAGG